MTISDLPTVNAILNSLATLMLIAGFIMIRRGHRVAHAKCMIGAVIFSVLFLTTYLIYHAYAGSVPYARYDWTRGVYFAILIPHIILAAVMVPPILVLLWLAYKRRFTQHKRLARWVWPVWIFVSISGVVIYLMLYHLPPT